MNAPRPLAVLLAAASLAAVVPFALAAEAPPGAPAPAPEMSNLQIFEGRWACQGEVPASPMGPGGAMTSTVESHTDLGGFWQSGTVKATGGGMPGTMEGSFRMTYEPGTKQYVLFWMDSMGAFSKAVSSAWEGDTMVFTGEGTMGGLTTPVRDSFTKGADGTLQHTWEIQADGKWMPMGKETCRKAG